MQIEQLSEKYIDQLIDVVEEYRKFCGFSASYEQTKKFFQYLFTNEKSVTFIAISDNDEVMGFVNLYPSYSTLALSKIWILNDLAVSSRFRRMGLAQKLIKRVITFAEETGAVRVELKTQITNRGAQKFYSEIGFKVDKDNIYYQVPVQW